MNEKMIIPGSIIIAGLLIGGAIYFGGTDEVQVVANNNSPAQRVEEPQFSDAKKVDVASDHIIGNPAAEIFVIEYSDLECPFCKRFHDTALSRLKETYVDDERVAFVFRHFPLDEPYTRALHPTAAEEAIASECAAKLGGTEAFYSFIDQIFEKTASDGNFDLSTLSTLAVNAGVDKTAFDTCYKNKDTEPVVSASFDEGVNAGVQGTPTVFIQTKDGKTYAAVPDYNALKVGIDAYLAELK